MELRSPELLTAECICLLPLSPYQHPAVSADVLFVESWHWCVHLNHKEEEWTKIISIYKIQSNNSWCLTNRSVKFSSTLFISLLLRSRLSRSGNPKTEKKVKSKSESSLAVFINSINITQYKLVFFGLFNTSLRPLKWPMLLCTGSKFRAPPLTWKLAFRMFPKSRLEDTDFVNVALLHEHECWWTSKEVQAVSY